MTTMVAVTAAKAQMAWVALGLVGVAFAVVGILSIGDTTLLPVLIVAMLIGAIFVWLD